jgi:hypothetical protein
MAGALVGAPLDVTAGSDVFSLLAHALAILAEAVDAVHALLASLIGSGHRRGGGGGDTGVDVGNNTGVDIIDVGHQFYVGELHLAGGLLLLFLLTVLLDVVADVL